MYLVYYGDQFVHDVYSDDRWVHDGKLSGDANSYLTLEFTMPPTHPLSGKMLKKDYLNPVRVTFGDQELFRGYIEDISETISMELVVKCKSDLAILADTVVRPYTTAQGDTTQGAEYIGSGFAKLFRWLIESHNKRVEYVGSDGIKHGAEKQFAIAYPYGSSLDEEGKKLDDRGNNYRSSSSKPSTLSELTEKIIDPLDAHLVVWYGSDGSKRIALYADAPEQLKNDQTVSFGETMTEYTYNDSCLDTYTAIRPEGGTDSGGSTITLSSIPDGPVLSDFYKLGDVVYHVKNVEKYGYREYPWSDSSASDSQSLLAISISKLQSMMLPSQGIDVSAVDMAFIDGRYRHLLPGQTVRVQSYVHHVDADLIVSSCSIDFDSPGSTRYTMGAPGTRLSKSYGDIIKEIVNTSSNAESSNSTALNALKTANESDVKASEAKKIAEESTAVSVVVQKESLSIDSSSESVLKPAEGVLVQSAYMVATGSVRQLYLEFTASIVVQSGEIIGTLSEIPAAKSTLSGVRGYLDTDGSIAVSESLQPGIYEISVVFVKEMQ